jgi:hypothetical protein
LNVDTLQAGNNNMKRTSVWRATSRTPSRAGGESKSYPGSLLRQRSGSGLPGGWKNFHSSAMPVAASKFEVMRYWANVEANSEFRLIDAYGKLLDHEWPSGVTHQAVGQRLQPCTLTTCSTNRLAAVGLR